VARTARCKYRTFAFGSSGSSGLDAPEFLLFDVDTRKRWYANVFFPTFGEPGAMGERMEGLRRRGPSVPRLLHAGLS